MSKAQTQKRAVVKDQHGKHIHLEHLEDVPEALAPDDLQHDLQQLLRHFCKEDLKQEAKWGGCPILTSETTHSLNMQLPISLAERPNWPNGHPDVSTFSKYTAFGFSFSQPL